MMTALRRLGLAAPLVAVTLSSCGINAVPTEEEKVNAAWGGDHVMEYGSVNISVAVAVDDGLVTPVIRNAQTLSLREISAAVKDLATRARTKKLKPEEFAGGTITVSNLGSYGIDQFYAIVNPPQSAIVAVGGIVKKPVVNAKDEKREARRAEAEERNRRYRERAAFAERIGPVEKEIEQMEARLKTIEAERADPATYRDAAKLRDLGREAADIARALETLYMRWEALAAEAPADDSSPK